MGRTHNDSNFGSRSESYQADKDRGFAKLKSRNWHHAMRNENRNSDEMSHVTSPNQDKVKRDGWPNNYLGQMGNIENRKTYKLNEILPNCKDTPLVEQIETEMNNTDCKNTQDYLRMCKKQLERRHKLSLFNGHKKTNKLDNMVSTFTD